VREPETHELIFALCHEVSNWLAASRMLAGALVESRAPGRAAEAAARISQLASRTNSLVSLIRPLLAQPSGATESVDPLEIFDGVERSLDESCSDRVRFDRSTAPSCPRAAIAAEPLHHLLLTLIYNALEDSRPSGVVAVSIEVAPRKLTLALQARGPERRDLATLRGSALSDAVAARILNACGGRLSTTHRDGANRVSVELRRV